MPDLQKLIHMSIDQGVDFLKENKPEIVQYFLLGGAWGLALGADDASRKLRDAIDIGHTGISLGVTLKGVFARAQDELGYRFTLSDAPNNPMTIANKVATLVLIS
jgi:hypothetical protein